MSKYVKDFRNVSVVISDISRMVAEYLDNLELCSHENNLEVYLKEFQNRRAGMNPEAMSDPENLAKCRERYQSNLAKYNKILTFKRGLTRGEYDTDINYCIHPTWVKILGQVFNFEEPINELYADAFEQLTNYLEDVEHVTTVATRDLIKRQHDEHMASIMCKCCEQSSDSEVNEVDMPDSLKNVVDFLEELFGEEIKMIIIP